MDFLPGKLVRSRVPDLIRNGGQGEPEVRRVQGREYTAALRTALSDAQRAYLMRADRESLAELYEILDLLVIEHGFTPDEIAQERERIIERYGDYQDRLFLDHVQGAAPPAPPVRSDFVEVLNPQAADDDPDDHEQDRPPLAEIQDVQILGEEPTPEA